MYRADHVYYHVHNEYPPEERSHGLFISLVGLVTLVVLGGPWLTQTGRHHKRPCGQAGPAYKVLAINIDDPSMDYVHGL
jgi:hypothetical protein